MVEDIFYEEGIIVYIIRRVGLLPHTILIIVETISGPLNVSENVF